MQIVIFNWRDIENPSSGGAEILTHELAKYWVRKGHNVTHFSSFFPGGKEEEVIDDIRYIRQGEPDLRTGFSSVHFKAFNYYRKHCRGKIDIIVDEIHGLPFFTPLYAKERVIVLICEVAKNIWDKMFPFPWNIIGKFAENISLKFYRKKDILTISQSTKNDLLSYGFPEQNIVILPMGFNRVELENVVKESTPTLIFVARINKMKGIEDAITMLSLVRKKINTTTLWVVGRGTVAYLLHIKKMVATMGLSQNVRFWDYVSEKEKFELMARAHILVAPSYHEGFGLTIPEAESVGTPTIVYNVPGLRDLVDNTNGVILKKNTPDELAKQVITLLSDKNKYNKFQANAKKHSEYYTWENTGKVSLTVLEN